MAAPRSPPSLIGLREALHPVLSEEEERGVTRLRVLVVILPSPRLASEVLRLLEEVFPLGSVGGHNLAHLKRVRRSVELNGSLEVVVGPLTLFPDDGADLNSADVSAALPERLRSFARRAADVPQFPPLTRAQVAEWAGLWPVTFHVREVTSPSVDVISDSLIGGIQTAYRACLVETQESPLGLAAAVIDEAGRLLAAVPDRRHESVLCHATVAAVEAVAAQARAALTSSRKRTSDGSTSDDGAEAYLCSGCTLVLIREPCVMCAMAAVHSRIARVVFANPNPARGALVSRVRLHALRSLNHRFSAYKLEGVSAIMVTAESERS